MKYKLIEKCNGRHRIIKITLLNNKRSLWKQNKQTVPKVKYQNRQITQWIKISVKT